MSDPVPFFSAEAVNASVDVGASVARVVKRNWFVVHLAAKRLSPTAEAFRAYVQKHGGAVLRAM